MEISFSTAFLHDLQLLRFDVAKVNFISPVESEIDFRRMGRGLFISVLVGDGDCIRGRTRCLLKSYNAWSSLVTMLGPLSEGNFLKL